MKKRIISLLLAFMMVISLAPAALAAEAGPPYSLKYLEGIEGTYLITTWEYDDYVSSTGEDVSQVTVDVYDTLDLWIGVDTDWERTVAPFRQRFKDAGFTEEVRLDDYNEECYWYTDGSGDLYRILGESESHDVIGESATVYVLHDFSVKFMDAQAPAGTLDNFTRSRTYTPGLLADVPATAWYAPDVQTAYELGLVNGSGAGYAPTASISIAETLVLACRIHHIYYGGDGVFTQGSPWYQVYVDYAVENEIISAGGFSDYAAAANRQIFASIMAKALPGTALAPINSIEAEAIPDSSSVSASFLPAVLRLYNAGILTGSDAQGTFNPASDIKRSEVAVIAARMVIPGSRKSFVLTVPEVPVEPGSVMYAGEDVPDFGAFAGIEEKGYIVGDFGTYHYYDLTQVQRDDTLVERYYDLLTEKGFQYRRLEKINGASVAVYGKDSVEVAVGAQERYAGSKDFCVLIGWGNAFPNAGTSSGESAPSIGADGQVSEEALINYACSDFLRIKREYSAATPLYANVSCYTNRDGEICVVTNVWYKIISNYNEVTLHNLTTGRTITDPVSFYDYMADQAWGAAKIRLLELENEVLANLNGKTYVTAGQMGG